MRGDWYRIGLLVLVLALLTAAASADWMLAVIQIISGWLTAFPGPTEHMATIAAAWGWPLAALLIAWWLRGPLANAAHVLAERFGTDDLNLWGLGISKGDLKIPLDRNEAQSESASFTPDDAVIIEDLYEFAGR